MTTKINNSTIVTNNTKRISAMKKYVTSKTEIPIGGAVLKPAQIIAVFQNSLDKRAAVTATQAEYRSAVAERVEAESTLQATDDSLKQWVLNRFGANSAEAIEFGYSARRTPAVSAAVRATAVQLNKATRLARGTIRKQDKLKIKGTLVAPTAPAAPANDAAPAANAPGVVPPINAPGAGGHS
jgi:hypothetical protein